MNSLKQQLMLLVICPLLFLAICLTVVAGVHLKDRAVFATTTKARSDLASGEAIIELMYPGPWSVRDGFLYKGTTRINNNFEAVDKIAKLTGDTVTIFQGDTRVSTTVREKSGDRAIGTKVSEIVATNVLKHGQQYLGEANVVGEFYQTAYKPIRDEDGRIVGMFYVGIAKKLTDQLIHDSLLTILAISAGITLVVNMIAWYFTNRAVIGPLQEITTGTWDAAHGHNFHKVDVNGPHEIGELATAFNQMVDEFQRLSSRCSQQGCANVNGNSNYGSGNNVQPFSPQGTDGCGVVPMVPIPPEYTAKEEELPKGLQESTFKQIMIFLEKQNLPMSAEEVGEGLNLTRVTARRYLEYLEKCGKVAVELKYGTVGRPVKLYQSIF